MAFKKGIQVVNHTSFVSSVSNFLSCLSSRQYFSRKSDAGTKVKDEKNFHRFNFILKNFHAKMYEIVRLQFSSAWEKTRKA